MALSDSSEGGSIDVQLALHTQRLRDGNRKFDQIDKHLEATDKRVQDNKAEADREWERHRREMDIRFKGLLASQEAITGWFKGVKFVFTTVVGASIILGTVIGIYQLIHH